MNDIGMKMEEKQMEFGMRKLIVVKIRITMPSLFLLLSLFVWSGLSARTSVLETPKTFVPKKKPPKTIQVEILQPGTDCTIRATRGDRAEV